MTDAILFLAHPSCSAEADTLYETVMQTMTTEQSSIFQAQAQELSRLLFETIATYMKRHSASALLPIPVAKGLLYALEHQFLLHHGGIPLEEPMQDETP